MKNIFLKSTIIILSLCIISTFGCKKMFDTSPKGVLIKDSALITPSDCQEALNAAYDVNANVYNGRVQSFNELLSDNVVAPNSNNDFREIYNRAVIYFNSTVGAFYGDCYRTVYRSNSVIDNVENIKGFAPGEKERLIAEAKFLRALAHFTVVRLYAQPYGFTSNNSHLGIIVKTNTQFESQQRSSCEETYQSIIKDLNDAIAVLPDDNSGGIYASKYSAKALLAKVYFQMNRFTDVVAQVNDIVASGKFSLADSLNRFDNSANSKKEFIFYVHSAATDRRSDALKGNFNSGGSTPPEISVSSTLYSDVGSRLGDKRAAYFEAIANGFFRLNKFSTDYFDIPVLHYTDLLLMRAEALAETNINLPQAINDVNAIISRAFGNNGQNISSTSTSGTIINAARLERRIELAFEGDRVQQLKRIGAKGEANITIRNASWNCNGLAIQFPASEGTLKGFQFNPEGGCN
jgi:hypothetical protein